MKNKRILLAFVMLMITGIALTTASYAWFSASTQAELGNIDVNVTASNGIQISMDAVNWKGTLTTDDIKGVAYDGNKNQIPTTLTPVSTIGSQSIGEFEMFDGIVDETGVEPLLTTTKAAAEKSTTEEGHYIAFDLFIKSATKKNVSLNTGSAVVATNTANPEEPPKDRGLMYSSRVAFFNQGTDVTNSPTAAIALSSGTDFTIWEPNANKHTALITNSGITGVQDTYGVKAEGTDLKLSEAKTDSEHFAKVTTVQSNVGSVPEDTMFTIEAGITKVRVYIWIEGQDVDCENNASTGTGIRTTIQLKAEVVSEEAAA